jgi:hypothetical protein
MRCTLLAFVLSALLAALGAGQAAAIGVNRLDSEKITTGELAVLGWYTLSYRVAFWENMTDAERDSLVWRANAAGVPLLPILTVRYGGVAHEPRAAAWDEWAAYVDKVVRRYPTVHSWEVWNEPNAVKFGGAFAVHRWRRFVSRTAGVIHRARPEANVVAGGVSVAQPEWRRYLAVSGVDAVGLHPYAPSAAKALTLVREAGLIARKPVWVTELDWTGGGERYQARELRQFVRRFHGPIWWYHLRGLFAPSWRPKPIWRELLRGRTPG